MLRSSNGFSQLINEPTQIQKNRSSCIDSIFTDQSNLSVNSGIHASLHTSFQRLIWHYKKADSEKIRKALDSVKWEILYSKKDIDARFAVFNKTILNIFCNYVPNKYITIDDKDLMWINRTITLKVKAKNNMYNKYIQSRRFESDFLLLEILITELNELITITNALHYENLTKKFNNPLLQAKTSWSILKTFYNKKKIPLISPLGR